MRLYRAGYLFVLAFGIVSCHDHRAFDSAVNQAESAVVDHRDIIASAKSIGAARDELDRHAAEIDADVRHIRSHLSDVDHCDQDDLDRVWDEVGVVEDRVSVYLLDAGATTEMAALRAVCDRYAADMDRLLGEVRDRLDDASCW